MGEPEKFKPKCSISQVQSLLSSLNLPTPESIEQMSVTSSFHQIFAVAFSETGSLQIRAEEQQEILGNNHRWPISGNFILRIAGHHIPCIKLANEVAILHWLEQNTSIPVPRVVKYSTSCENSLGYEYMLMTRSRGVTASTIYNNLSPTQMKHILDQLTDHLLQLYRLPFSHIGGLRLTDSNDAVSGPPCEEIMWMVPEIEQCFGGSESFSTLNPTGENGYPTFTNWIAAYMQCYIHAISVCQALNSWLDEKEVQLLRKFIDFIQQPIHAEKLNHVRLVMAHRDLHFAQILVDVTDSEKAEITAILDWEFAQVVPFPLWRRSFLWNANLEQPSKDSSAERARLTQIWEQEVEQHEEGRAMLAAEQWPYHEQQSIWDMCNYVRCIVEVVPRGKQLSDAKRWWTEVLRVLRDLGVN